MENKMLLTGSELLNIYRRLGNPSTRGVKMEKETILTDEEIIGIGQQARAIESGANGYILPISFARAIEQAILHKYRDLRDERVVLRDALETMVEMVEMNGFGRDYAMDVARAALAQEQGGNTK